MSIKTGKIAKAATTERRSIASGQSGRAGKVQMGFWVEPDLRRQLKLAAVETNLPIQDILTEAAEDWLAKKGK